MTNIVDSIYCMYCALQCITCDPRHPYTHSWHLSVRNSGDVYRSCHGGLAQLYWSALARRYAVRKQSLSSSLLSPSGSSTTCRRPPLWGTAELCASVSAASLKGRRSQQAVTRIHPELWQSTQPAIVPLPDDGPPL